MTENQLKAVRHQEGPLLIVAGAGTGKTRVITNRIAYLIEEKKVPPSGILAVTFTNNAAEEMRARLASMISGSFDELWIGTFHSLGADILREHAIDFGISPFFRIITPGEQLLLLADEMDNFGLKYHQVKGRPYALLSELLKKITKAKDELVTAGEYQEWALRSRSNFVANKSVMKEKERLKQDDLIGKGEDFVNVYNRYNELLLQNDYLDFADLISNCIRLFKEKPHILGDYQNRWQYILVDEFQDTNLAQSRMIDLISAGGSLCVVGDDDQSIYRFRGAAISNILEFRDRYQDTAEIYLEENFRSTSEILDGAFAVVGKNTDRLDKRLRSAHKRTDKNSLTVIEAESPAVEANFVTRTIIDLINSDEKITLSDFAVLARRKSDLKEIARSLSAAGLPFNLSGGSGFFDRTEIRDIVAWLRTISDPFENDAVIRTLEAEPFGLDQVESSRFNRWCRDKKIQLIDGLKRPDRVRELDPAAAIVINRWMEVFEKLSSQRYQVSVEIILRQVLDLTGYRLPLIRRESMENIRKLANIAQLEQLAGQYVNESNDGGIRRFISYIKLLQAAGEDAPVDIKPVKDSVNMMTIHKSKGLEFHTVFLIGATDNAFPGRRRAEAFIPDELLKESAPLTQATHEAESRRLFYVACTRAKKRLFITYSLSADETGKPLKRSRFIEEIIETGPPVNHVNAGAFSPVRAGLTALSRKAESELMAAVDKNYLLPSDDGDALILAAAELASYFDLKKTHAALSAKNKNEAIVKIDFIIDKMISPEYRSIVRSDQFTTKIVEAAIGEGESDWLDKISAVDYTEFLPLNDRGGLNLSVSDIIDYQRCPYAFKNKHVYQIPPAPMAEAEFGTFFHTVLEAFHHKYNRELASLDELTALYDEGVKVRQLGRTTSERQLVKRGRNILPDYLATFKNDVGIPTFFERNFEWHLDPHWIRGRVDRADLLPDGGYELIDYKTGKAWNPNMVRNDLQLAIYSLATARSWEIKPTQSSYYFLMENKKMPVAFSEADLSSAEETIKKVAADILAQRFDYKVDYMACRHCDFRLLCPAHEK